MPDRPAASVDVVHWTTAPAETEPVDHMGPASGRHARPGPWRRTVTAGQHALADSANTIAAQVDEIAAHMTAALERHEIERADARAAAGQPAPVWRPDQVDVTFGVQLTGETSVAVFSAATESSAQITLTFTRATA